MSETVTGVFKGFTKTSPNKGGWYTAIIEGTGLEYNDKPATYFQTGKKPLKIASGTQIEFDAEEGDYGYTLDPKTIVELEAPVKKSNRTTQEATGSTQGTGSQGSSGYNNTQLAIQYQSAQKAAVEVVVALLSAGRMKSLSDDEVVAEVVRHTQTLYSATCKLGESATPQVVTSPKPTTKKPTKPVQEDDGSEDDSELPF